MQLGVLVLLALLAFAANSVLCRMALHTTDIDPYSFTLIRMVSAVVMLAIILMPKRALLAGIKAGSWQSAGWLLLYAVCFSLSYIELTAATGALVLFATVQIVMLAIAWRRGDTFCWQQMLGFAAAVLGLLWLLSPGLSAPEPIASLLMIAAGAGWAKYTLAGQGGGDPTQVTLGNFARTVPILLVLCVFMLTQVSLPMTGILYAIASGAVASGVGYALWYAALPFLKASTAATLQLSVPVIAAIGGVVLLDEQMTMRLVVASIAILGGVAVVLRYRR
jgi:drug/metabolite transporter (DMT)-like permease